MRDLYYRDTRERTHQTSPNTSASNGPLRVSPTRPARTTACPDWEHRIVNGIPLTPCDPLVPSAAEAGMSVFNELEIVDAGVMFGDSRPWIKSFAESIFGSGTVTLKGTKTKGDA